MTKSAVSYFLDPITDAFKTQGRASRREYWMFVLYAGLLGLGLLVLGIMCGLTFEAGERTYGIMSQVYDVLLLVPSVTLIVRRLHDTNKSGWVLGWVFVFVPVWVMLMSVAGENAAPASPAAHRSGNACRHGCGSAIGRTILSTNPG